MRRSTSLALTSASSFAIAFVGLSGTAMAQAQTAPLPEQCANITDDAQRQACAEAAEQRDPLANSGQADTLPTEGPASADASSCARRLSSAAIRSASGRRSVYRFWRSPGARSRS